LNVLVTGAAGFVGSHLVPALIAAGHTVFAAHYDLDRLPPVAGARRLQWDLAEPGLPAALPAEIGAIVHLAQANVPFPDRANEMFAVHVAATQRLLSVALRAGARRFVFASTGSIYGSGHRDWIESDPTEGPGYYAATKVAAERLIRAYGGLLSFAIFRLFAPYGPGQSNRLVPRLIAGVTEGRPVQIAGGTGAIFNPVHVKHVVDVLVQSLETKHSHVLNLGGDETLSVRDMAETVGRVVGRAPVFEQPAYTGTEGAPERVVGDNTALRRTYRLPERLTSFEDGVRSMIQA